MVNLKDGRTVHLWQDLWNNQVHRLLYPQLHSFAKKEQVTVAQAKDLEQLHELFHLPLSEQAYQQYILLSTELDNIHIQMDQDIWTYIWGSSVYSSRKVYKALSGHMLVHPAFNWLWACKCQPKYKFFFSGSCYMII